MNIDTARVNHTMTREILNRLLEEAVVGNILQERLEAVRSELRC